LTALKGKICILNADGQLDVCGDIVRPDSFIGLPRNVDIRTLRVNRDPVSADYLQTVLGVATLIQEDGAIYAEMELDEFGARYVQGFSMCSVPCYPSVEGIIEQSEKTEGGRIISALRITSVILSPGNVDPRIRPIEVAGNEIF
jgi:hypothetical protein